jgi:hypothetical protein
MSSAGQQVQPQRLAGLPVAGDLQHGRSAEAAVGEQQVFVEAAGRLAAAGGHLHRQRCTGQWHERCPQAGIESERHQGRACRHDGMAELPGQTVADVGGADLRDRQPAAGHHELRAAHRAGAGVELEAAVDRPHRGQAAGLPALHAAGIALGQQQVDDLLGRVVAEQLALVLLMEADAVAPHQRDEISRRVARQCRPAEVRVGRQELRRRGVAVGEVAAAAARDADLLGQLLGMVDHQHPQAALPGDAGTEQPGRTGAEDHGVEVGWGGRHGAR